MTSKPRVLLRPQRQPDPDPAPVVLAQIDADCHCSTRLWTSRLEHHRTIHRCGHQDGCELGRLVEAALARGAGVDRGEATPPPAPLACTFTDRTANNDLCER